jgi:hypothetical protein
VEPALRAIVRSYEYEDWPRGRIVFDRARDLFVLYADRKLLTPATIARIATQFHLPPEYTETQSGWPYHSAETPNGLGTRSCQSRKTVECIALIETDT